jgi:hypothetical protein
MFRKTTLTALLCAASAGALSASSVCPSTPNTTSDCDFIITIATTGTVNVATVPGSTPFNSPMTLADGTMVPGGDASLIGVVNDYSRALTSLTLEGSGASSGIFDFNFNGICVYTSAGYCATAATGYEGPTTTFGNIKPGTNPFESAIGTVTFGPALSMGQNTYFSLQDSAADLNANGGLKVLSETFAGSTATPEPTDFALIALGGVVLLSFRNQRQKRIRD